MRAGNLYRTWAIATVGLLVSAVALTGCGSAKSKSAPPPDRGSATLGAGVAMPDEAAMLETLPAALAADGTTIVVGKSTALTSISIYEDPRCPYCMKFERTVGPLLAQRVMQGTVKIKYTLASFLDDRLGGTGSANAAAAARAALDAGQFPLFHAILYANQPVETEDGFTNQRLLDLASVLRGPRVPALNEAIKSHRYRDWARKSQEAFTAAGKITTPTVLINDHIVTPDSVKYDSAAFTARLDAATRG
ncbi:MAG: hypothetical protein QOE71_4107 [Pseudonocardiales bacterium]|nr:hypothetical protein [Pseudonocardiales bacterium]